MLTYLQNLVRLSRGDFTLAPRLAVYYVTLQCNLNCAYCEDFGSRRNQQVMPNPSLDEAKQILNVIRTGVDRLWLTGGEPLMVPYLLELLEYARHGLKFHEISLITNGTLLSRVENNSSAEIMERTQKKQINSPVSSVVEYLDRLIISLDSTDPQALSIVSVPNAYAETVITNAREAASLQKKYKFRLIVNAVITPETLR